MTTSSEKAKRPSAEESLQAQRPVPADWRKGELLNVRNRGDFYVVTRYPEEYDAEKPNRAVKFTNLGECQNFVSDWYSRQTHDPRAR
ncbi:MAG: hypothetical protein C0465_23670 [Ralstonia sp.]|jgi:Ni/Co efflux regulator RcnB|uniref:Uncharacterized protein n=2 Tax=Ralstonia pickettii TaxID=329 RepID=A0ABN9I7D9_RALPI|nr:hypothetical protein [Ralstonia sp.]MBA4238522.1 hypothetical protein [Ralstonia sp.]MBA4404482.1 hypothetical protein [Ralstonia sp.]POH87431.1 hypothetical protein CJ026_011290 [Ralstonia pickettii]CAJ0732836.1 hypothetical protein R38712_05107 [Ralstonia pickettii]